MKVLYLVLIHVVAGYVVFGETVAQKMEQGKKPDMPLIRALVRHEVEQLDKLTEEDREQLNELFIWFE